MIEKAQQLGAKVATCSDSTGWIYNSDGIDVEALKEIKEVKQQRLIEYKKYRPGAEYHEGKGVWSIKCDIALPCATQNELGLEDAKVLTIHAKLKDIMVDLYHNIDNPLYDNLKKSVQFIVAYPLISNIIS